MELKPCPFCAFPSKNLIAAENGDNMVFVEISGAYLRIFDDEMPGLLDGVHINFCPMCGRKLLEQEG